MLKENIITASRVRQNNQEFLVGIFSIKEIRSLTRFTPRLIDYWDEYNYPVYNKRIQREVENSRVIKIADFLMDDPDAIFPTNLVLSIPNAAIENIENTEPDGVNITLNQRVLDEMGKDDGDVYVTIIDGQHRVKGIEKAIATMEIDIDSLRKVSFKSKDKEDFDLRIAKKYKRLNDLLNIKLLVTFFVDPSLEFQAMIFSTINRTQKSVPQSLVSSLFGLTEKDTPQKSALEIVLALNAFESSPFFNRVKLHGGVYEKNQSPPLTQAAMVKSIVELISTNERELERDRFRERSELRNSGGPNFPFRTYYANDKDPFITDILFSFFSAVRTVFVKDGTSLWQFDEKIRPENILHTIVGYQALLSLLTDILTKEVDDAKRDKEATFVSYLSKCQHLKVDDQQRYPFTSISKTIFYLDMHLSIWPAQTQNDARIIKRDQALKKREA